LHANECDANEGFSDPSCHCSQQAEAEAEAEAGAEEDGR